MITKARIVPGDGFSTRAQVIVTINGKEQPLFEYYDDELSFHPSEFIGLTIEEGRALFTKKDIEYLRS